MRKSKGKKSHILTLGAGCHPDCKMRIEFDINTCKLNIYCTECSRLLIEVNLKALTAIVEFRNVKT